MSDDLVRIADADREQAAARLGDHYAEGRLDHDEYSERLDAVWTARTRADLAILFHDLPLAQPAAPLVPPTRRSGGRPRWVAWLWVALALLALAVVAHEPWLLVVALVAGAVFVKRRRQRRTHPVACRGGGW